MLNIREKWSNTILYRNIAKFPLSILYNFLFNFFSKRCDYITNKLLCPLLCLLVNVVSVLLLKASASVDNYLACITLLSALCQRFLEFLGTLSC